MKYCDPHSTALGVWQGVSLSDLNLNQNAPYDLIIKFNFFLNEFKYANQQHRESRPSLILIKVLTFTRLIKRHHNQLG